MARRAKLFIAILLLPVCIGVLRAMGGLWQGVEFQGVVMVPLVASADAAARRWLVRASVPLRS